MLRLNWARPMRSPVCCSCHGIKSFAHATCVMRLWLWLPVASHQPLSNADILLSPTLPRTHPSSSGSNHPSENGTPTESRGSAVVHWRTHEETAHHSHLCDCRIQRGLSSMFSRERLKSLFFFFLIRSSYPFPPSEHKTKMRIPLSCDNFPRVKPIECHWAVSNLSGKVLERYSRMLDVHV